MPGIPAADKLRIVNSSAATKSFSADTLQYSVRGVIVLFFWLLCGDFCLTLVEFVIPYILPLELKDQDASSRLIAGLMSVVPGIINLTWVPSISTWSDRVRTRWGRRIPFMLAGAPAMALVLAAIGGNDAISEAVHRLAPGGLPLATIRLVTLSALMVGFYLCNVLALNLYFLLFNDVVPPRWMGRFAFALRMVGTLAGSAFHYFIFPHAGEHRGVIFLGVGLLFAAAYLLMCLNVKEGAYPPHEPIEGGRGPRALIRTYVRQCFSHRYYVYIYLYAGFDVASEVIKPFLLLLMNLTLGLSLAEIGWINGTAMFLGLVGNVVGGLLMERIHIVRLCVWLKGLQSVVLAGFVVYLFSGLPEWTGWGAALAFNVLFFVLHSARCLVQIPVNMTLLPRLHYGQISSAMQATAGAMGILGGFVAGALMDGLLGLYGGSHFAYRWVPAWALIFNGLAAWSLWQVDRLVRAMHGPDIKSFVPPDPTLAAAPR